ncbi:MAG: permease-like cell division protein FtsX [Candidatus Geothermincolia bacterium]
MTKNVMITSGSLLVGLIIVVVLMFTVYQGPIYSMSDGCSTTGSRVTPADMEAARSSPGTIRVFVKDGISDDEAAGLERIVRKMAGVTQVKYVSKEEALEEYKAHYRDEPEMIRHLEGNPFPATIEIKAKNWDYCGDIAAQINEWPQVVVNEVGKPKIENPSYAFKSIYVRFSNKRSQVRWSAIGAYLGAMVIVMALTLLMTSRKRSKQVRQD